MLIIVVFLFWSVLLLFLKEDTTLLFCHFPQNHKGSENYWEISENRGDLLLSFAQWRYSNQWSNREVLLLLVENYTQYPAISTWNIVVIGNFWRLIFEQLQLAPFQYPISWLKCCELAFEIWTFVQLQLQIKLGRIGKYYCLDNGLATQRISALVQLFTS